MPKVSISVFGDKIKSRAPKDTPLSCSFLETLVERFSADIGSDGDNKYRNYCSIIELIREKALLK